MLTLNDIFSEPSRNTERFFREEDLSTGRSVVDLLRPFLSFAENRIAGLAADTEEILCPGSLNQSLDVYLHHLHEIIYGIISLKEQPSDRTEWEQLFSSYPGLERLTLRWTEDFTDYIGETVHALKEFLSAPERLNISPVNNRLKRFFTHDADIHEGKYVNMMELESGERLVYKPRSADTDRLLEVLSERLTGFAECPALRFPKWVATSSGTFYEYIRSEPILSEEGYRRYFFRLGVFLLAELLLGASDTHAENIVADGEYPLAIDTETVSSEFAPSAEGMHVSFTAILPFLILDHGYREVGDAACGKIGESRNLPHDPDGNTRTAYEYRENFEAGFRSAYEAALQNREKLCSDEELRDCFCCHVRYLFQNTFFYQKLLEFGRQKRFLTEDRIPEHTEEILQRRRDKFTAQRDLVRVAEEAENRGMRNGYIPKVVRFYSDRENNPLYDAFLTRLERLSPEHLRDQMDYIHSVLHSGKTTDGADKLSPLTLSSPSPMTKSRLSRLADEVFGAALSEYQTKKFPMIIHTGPEQYRYYLSLGVPCMPECTFGLLPAARAFSRIGNSKAAEELEKRLADDVLHSVRKNTISRFTDGLAEGKGGILLLSELLCEMGCGDFTAPLEAAAEAVLSRAELPFAPIRYSSCSLFYGIAGFLPPLMRLPEAYAAKAESAIRTYADQILADTTPTLLKSCRQPGIGFADRILGLLICREKLDEKAREKTDALTESLLTEEIPVNPEAIPLLSLYAGRRFGEEPIQASECENLRFGNALLLTALTENGFPGQAEQLADRILDQTEKAGLAGKGRMGEPENTVFPSFCHGYGGLLYTLLRVYEPSLPGIFKK